jgi:hypothetical protein
MTLWPSFKVMWSKMAVAQKNLHFLVHKKNYSLTKQLYIVEYFVFSWKKAVWDIDYSYIFQIVWALLGGTELGLFADFSIKLSSAQKTVSLVSSKFVCRWWYHIRNWICGVAHTRYVSWDHIKCNNTWGVSHMPYWSWDSKLGRMGYALRRQRVKHC